MRKQLSKFGCLWDRVCRVMLRKDGTQNGLVVGWGEGERLLTALW